jgi:hypothetical protein
MEKFLSLAGGRINCLRCTAKSVRSGNQCLKPALKSSRTQKCGHHGGRNKGPVTEAGKARSAAAHIKTGEFAKQSIRERSQKLAEMMNLEEQGYIFLMQFRLWSPIAIYAIRTKSPKIVKPY